ncbi:pilus assembly FimT family protein [Elongatibacter sediminis]|uniref:Type II secretion system protein H n=1 Tax=Elongatibacter sediminis TaxID=3119006 RepID=A0AAW9RE29_9GAMM
MNGFGKGETHKGRASRGLRAANSGFGLTELVATVGMVAVVIGLGIPSYENAVEKRRVAQGAEHIAAFVNSVQSESIKRNRMVAVSYATETDGSWCIGAVLGQLPCDCTETRPEANGYCALEGEQWALRDRDIETPNLIRSVSGDGAYVFDPVRGLFTDSSDVMSLGLGAADSNYQVNLDVIPTGRVSVCLPEPSESIQGFNTCSQDL